MRIGFGVTMFKGQATARQDIKTNQITVIVCNRHKIQVVPVTIHVIEWWNHHGSFEFTWQISFPENRLFL